MSAFNHDIIKPILEHGVAASLLLAFFLIFGLTFRGLGLLFPDKNEYLEMMERIDIYAIMILFFLFSAFSIVHTVKQMMKTIRE